MTRVSLKDLEQAEASANYYLRRAGIPVRLRVEGRYGYTAIDLADPKGQVIDTLASGLTRREALTILQTIRRILSYANP